MDGLDHAVSDDDAASGLAAGQGIYTALCGHQIHATALASSAGPSCPRCTQLTHEIQPSTTNPHRHRQHHHQRARLRRLLRRY
jgi:hypothetical protein